MAKKNGKRPLFGQKRVLKRKIIKKNSNNLKIGHKITKNRKKNNKIYFFEKRGQNGKKTGKGSFFGRKRVLKCKISRK